MVYKDRDTVRRGVRFYSISLQIKRRKTCDHQIANTWSVLQSVLELF